MDPRLWCASMSYDDSRFSVNMTFRYLFQWTKLRVSLKITEAFVLQIVDDCTW